MADRLTDEIGNKAVTSGGNGGYVDPPPPPATKKDGYEPLSFTGYDSYASLFVYSDLVTRIDVDDPSKLLERGLIASVTERLGWQLVSAISRQLPVSDGMRERQVITIWQLPADDPGTAYLNGVTEIATWDEYAALSQYITRWTYNLYRSSGFNPARLEKMAPTRNGALTGDQALTSDQTARVPFKEDLIVAEKKGSAPVSVKYLPLQYYTKRDVSGRYSYVETLAKNGVTRAHVSGLAELRAVLPFKFVNLNGLKD